MIFGLSGYVFVPVFINVRCFAWSSNDAPTDEELTLGLLVKDIITKVRKTVFGDIAHTFLFC